MAGGALTESIVLDVAHLNHIKEITTDHVIVEPGVYYRDMDAATLTKGVIMPSFPASRNLCAVGGMTGTNASGEMTLTYGSTRDWVKRLKVVLLMATSTSSSPYPSELEEKKKLPTLEGDIYRRMSSSSKTTTILSKPRNQTLRKFDRLCPLGRVGQKNI